MDFNGSVYLSAWVIFEPISTYSAVICKGSSGTVYALSLNPDGMLYFIGNWNNPGQQVWAETDPGDVVPNDWMWHHIEASYDQVWLRLYIDGELKKAVPFSHPLVNNTQPLYIGLDPPGTPERFKGAIDEVFIATTRPPNAPLPEPTVADIGFGTRMRYLSFLGGTPGASEAVRVQFDVDGVIRTMYVGQPFEVSESSQDAGSTPPTFWAAPLQCDRLFTDWSIYPAVHAFDESVVPSSVYDLSLVASGCEANEAAYSVPLTIETSQWGDVAGEPYADGVPCSVSASGYMDCWSPPDGDADFDDITAVVDKFRNVPGAPAKSRADVAPEVPDRVVDFTDIPAVVDGFRGLPYPYPGPPTIDPCVP